jgi:hypothetical protein
VVTDERGRAVAGECARVVIDGYDVRVVTDGRDREAADEYAVVVTGECARDEG